MIDVLSIKESKILISALDWGFGHTTRTSVIIKQLLEQNNSVVFAGNKDQIAFIEKEFPKIQSAYLEGYNITLSSFKNTYLQILKQIPKLFLAIKRETKWVKQFTKSKSFDYVISDNRYGFYDNKVISIFLTHQLNLEIPFGQKIANQFIRKNVNKFAACWIPDFPESIISGSLSNGNINVPKIFIGPLSRFKIDLSVKKKIDYLFIISGPSPEKLFFFRKAVKFLEKNQLNAVISIPFKDSKNKNLVFTRVVELPSRAELEDLINESKIVVAKAGYTTIMDLLPYKKPMILIPTKGQYEQEYLWKKHYPKCVSDKMSQIIISEFS